MATPATCPLCRSNYCELVLRIQDTPVHQHVTGVTETEARACPRAEVALTLCRACGFVFNAAFEPHRLRYSPGYENAQTYSKVFQSYLDSLVADLARRYELAGKTVVEIGCGEGVFLERLHEVTGCNGVGFDPSYNSERGAQRQGCTFAASIYDPAHPDSVGEVVCARHVVEHLWRPIDLVRDFVRALPARSGCAWIETPRLEWILEQRAFWDIFYEHCSYFTMPVLAALLTRHGFVVTRHRPAFADQYQWLEAQQTGDGHQVPDAVSCSVDDLAGKLREFADAWTTWRDTWQWRLRALAGEGPCVMWGAGAKGVMFLNHVEAGVDVVQAVVDLNPRKQGRFVPGTGQPIIPPAAVRQIAARTVLVANSNYLTEIRDLLRQQGCDPDVLVLEQTAS